MWGSQGPQASFLFAAPEAMSRTFLASHPLRNLPRHKQCSVHSNRDHFISHGLVQKVLV